MPDQPSASDFAAIVARLTSVEQKAQSHGDWQNNLQGDGQIRVEGGKIILSAKPGGKNTSGDLAMYAVFNGILYNINVNGEILSPV